MPVEIQVSGSNSPRASTRTPRTGTPSASPSRNRSFSTHRATATWKTAAPFGAARTSTPPSVQTCGTDQPSVAAASRRVPAVRVTGNSSPIHRLPAAGLLADLPGEVEALERELDGPRTLAVVLGVEAVADLVVEVGLPEHGQAHQEVARRHLLAGSDHLAGLDPVDEQGEVDAPEVSADGLGDRGPQQVREDLELASLLARLELDLAAEHVDGGLEVDDPRHSLLLPLPGRPVQGRGGDRLRPGDREARTDTRALVHGGGLAQVAGEAGEDLDEVVRYLGDELGLLADDRHLVLELGRVVRADLGAEAVLERGDDATAVGVVLGVGARHDESVERKPQHVATDLDV